MERTNISLPADLHARLRALAAARGVSMVTVIRDALENQLKNGDGSVTATRPPKLTSLGVGASGDTAPPEKAGEPPREKARPKPTIIGIAASGYTDTATTVATERVPPRSWR